MLSAKYDWKWIIQVKQIRNTTRHKYEWRQINKSYCLNAKMASSWNEDWEEIRNRCSRKYNITLWTNTTCENGLQPKWGLGGGLVWPSSSSIVTLWEFFLLIWILEACTRSIFLNMSTLQCNFFPGSAFVSQFPTFWGIGNPTDFQVSWGTWLGELRLTCIMWLTVVNLFCSDILIFY